MWYPGILLSKSLCIGAILYPYKNKEIYDIDLHIPEFFHVILHFALLHHMDQRCMGHMWDTSILLCGSMGQVAKQV